MPWILINNRGSIIEGCWDKREADRLRGRYYRLGVRDLKVRRIDRLPEKLR